MISIQCSRPSSHCVAQVYAVPTFIISSLAASVTSWSRSPWYAHGCDLTSEVSHTHSGPRSRICWYCAQRYAANPTSGLPPIPPLPLPHYAVGKRVKHLKEGDRVAMEPGATCRVCDDCKRGRYEVSLVECL